MALLPLSQDVAQVDADEDAMKDVHMGRPSGKLNATLRDQIAVTHEQLAELDDLQAKQAHQIEKFQAERETLIAALRSAERDVDMAMTLYVQSGTDPLAWMDSARQELRAALASVGGERV